MLKQTFIIILVSIVILLFQSYAHQILLYLWQFHQAIISVLNTVFSGGKIALLIRDVLALLSVPLIIVGLISAIYVAIRKHAFPHIILLFWGLWLIMITALVLK